MPDARNASSSSWYCFDFGSRCVEREHDLAAAGTEERARGLAHAGRDALGVAAGEVEHVDLVEGIARLALALEHEPLAVRRPVAFAGALAFDREPADAAQEVSLLRWSGRLLSATGTQSSAVRTSSAQAAAKALRKRDHGCSSHALIPSEAKPQFYWSPPVECKPPSPCRMGLMKRLAWLSLCVLAVSCDGCSRPAEDVRMIEVAGEGAKYWPRWRGPSGQGHVPAGQYTDKWSPTTGVVEGDGARPRQLVADRLGRPHLPHHRLRQRRAPVDARVLARRTARSCGRPFIPQNGVEYTHAKNGYASATPATDGRTGLRVVRPPRPVRVRLQRQDRLAAQVRRHRQLSRPGRLAGALQGSRLHLPGREPRAGTGRVRRRLRQEDRQADLDDAALRNRRAGARRW